MAASHARLAARSAGGRPRVDAAAATVPQRWTVARPAADGWLEVVHQFLGDGVFGGDVHRTTIDVREATGLVVRAVSAMPLRAGRRSQAVTRLRVRPHASLIYLPGALIPQVDADHAQSLRIEAASNARVMAAQVVVPGRSGMGEDSRYRRLRLRTAARVDGALAFLEDAVIEPAGASHGAADFAGLGAAVSVIILGDWGMKSERWIADICAQHHVRGAASPLRLGGGCLRALCASLGEAQDLVAHLESAARALGVGDEAPAPTPIASLRG